MKPFLDQLEKESKFSDRPGGRAVGVNRGTSCDYPPFAKGESQRCNHYFSVNAYGVKAPAPALKSTANNVYLPYESSYKNSGIRVIYENCSSGDRYS